MKSINKNMARFISRLCTVVLAVIGFSACENEDMYGTPYGTFEIKGKVTTEDGTGVKDAVIIVTGPTTDSTNHVDATTESDENGNYTAKGSSWPDDLKVVCRPAGDTLEADSVVVEMAYKRDKKDKGSWYNGHAEATVNFKLKNKQPALNNNFELNQ